MMPDKIKNGLLSCVKNLSSRKSDYVNQPQRDFTRSRELSFEHLILALLEMGGQSLSKELFQLGFSLSNSAFVQSRYKIKYQAFQDLFNEFTAQIYPDTDYPILAADGTDLNIPVDSTDTESYFPSNNGSRPYNLLHLNALFDLTHGLYVDAQVQPRKQMDERAAFLEMVRTSSFQKALVILDRGYESYNLMAHLNERDWNYIIRIKGGKTGMKRSLQLPEDTCLDEEIHLEITRKLTQAVKESTHYKWMPSHQVFDFLPSSGKDASTYHLSFRIVCFELDNGQYETLVTNTDFEVEKLKSLYASRWGIETSFRSLKYSLGLVSFHSRKRIGILQEIFLHLTMYNFTQAVASQIPKRRSARYVYKTSFSDAAYACRLFLRGEIPISSLTYFLTHHLVPIREKRRYKRKIRYRSVIGFIYRIA